MKTDAPLLPGVEAAAAQPPPPVPQPPKAKRKRKAAKNPRVKVKHASRVLGRQRRLVDVVSAVLDPETGAELKPAVKKMFVFEFRADGLHVRRLHCRRSTERLWPFQHLANGAAGAGQMEMFPGSKGAS